jgi:tetratricopeptide (TPR) repeat protein
MSDTTKSTPTLADRLSTFLSRYRRLLLVIGALVVIGVLGAVLAYQVHENRMEQAAREAELLRADWREWSRVNPATADDEELAVRARVEERIRDRADTIIDDFSRSYGALSALQILADLAWEQEQYEDVLAHSLRIIDRFPNSHLAGTALANAAAAAEEMGEPEKALEYLRRIAEGEGGAPTAEKPRALFNLGRLSEQLEEPREALRYYNQLVDEHPGGSWTNLGRNRIIWLTSQGAGTDT